MNSLVKQLVDDDGETVDKINQVWHLLDDITGGEAGLLCTGEYVDEGCDSGNGSEYLFKAAKRGGITCPDCMRRIKEIKAVRL